MTKVKKNTPRFRLLRNALIQHIVEVDKLPVGNAAIEAGVSIQTAKKVLKDPKYFSRAGKEQSKYHFQKAVGERFATAAKKYMKGN